MRALSYRPAMAKPTVIVKTALQVKSLQREEGKRIYIQATTKKPQTMTTGPPVF